MALLHCTFQSRALAQATRVTVALPDPAYTPPGGRYPVLYLLHGLLDDDSAWVRHTGVERWATARGLAVIMPAAGRSFYQDMTSGAGYWTFVSEELPAAMTRYLPLRTGREDTFAAGLSMGGYGALRLGLRQPERFAAVASLSGALDVVRRCREGSRLSAHELRAIFGDELAVEGSDADLHALAAACPGPRPDLFLACGTEDALLAESRAFRATAEAAGFAVSYAESPGGHDWDYWDEQIRRMVAWLPVGTSG